MRSKVHSTSPRDYFENIDKILKKLLFFNFGQPAKKVRIFDENYVAASLKLLPTCRYERSKEIFLNKNCFLSILEQKM